MLWDASAIHGYTIRASDGGLGGVSDLLFSDDDWRIRWLVVDTGNWLPGRKVLLHPSALGQPDPALRQLPVKLTKRQVKDSPDIYTDQPVSRQIQANLYDYFGWDPAWGDSYFDIGTQPDARPYSPGSKPPRSGSGDTRLHHGDPHLRSVRAVTGYHIHATDGVIGHVEDLLVDDVTWGIKYIVVDTRNWWPGEKVLISPDLVWEIEWIDRLIALGVPREQVKTSPRYDPSKTVDRSYEERLRTHYGWSDHRH